ncbi:PACE efflux transporter [Serratia ficaria]|uniref:PACE efflux transporter n=1 Tax=Serratia ficaria TaxID=61651 RepID=UPI002179CD31|nr:PACE efflux transporter [Serratia ficaria]CAI1122632.1 Predicted membrane protein [Serratia ficaria]CAI1543260.1 Predicted membrane protein [Serratia ficaria]
MNSLDHLNKKTSERIFHAILFEVVANLMIIILMTLILSVTLAESTVLACTSALVATVWNFLYNKFFDALQQRIKFPRTFIARVIHAIFFEAGLIVILVPIAAWWLSVSLTQAFFLEVALILFFLPYTVAFNWIYDVAREFIVTRSPSSAVTPPHD